RAPRLTEPAAPSSCVCARSASPITGASNSARAAAIATMRPLPRLNSTTASHCKCRSQVGLMDISAAEAAIRAALRLGSKSNAAPLGRKPRHATAGSCLAERRGTNRAGSATFWYPDHQGTVTGPKPDPLWRSPEGDVELMAQKKVLDFKPA